MNLDGFSMRPLTLELEKFLVGGRVDKITQQNKANLTMTIRQPGKTFLLRLSTAPQNPSVHLLKKSPENLPEPPTFCMVLRKNLENGRVAAIRQHELDRIIFIDVDSIGAGGKIQTFTLAAELIGKYSNLILISDGQIIDALKKIGTNSSRVRTVLPNQNYQLPPAQDKLDIFSVDVEKILERIQADKDLRLDKAIMNTCQGFGPQSVKETIFLSGLPNDMKISALDAKDFDSLKNSLIEIRDAAKSPVPCMIEDSGKILAISAVKLNYLRGNVKIFSTLSELLEVADEIAGSYVPPDKEKFSKLVNNELRRATNKISVLENELAVAENADDWRIRADNLSTYRYQFKDHADDEITVENIYDGEKISIPLDRRLTIAANVQACYKKYDKLKRSTKFIAEQIKLCREEIFYLESIAHALTASTTIADIDEIRTELIAGGYLKEIKKRTAPSKKPQPLKFIAPDGTEILVGKNNSQNDRLTFKIAAPDDLWLHTKEITGSHVIIRSSQVSDETLQLAAEIAAHFSKAQNSSKVPVDYVQCKFVKKPSGAKPGFVIFTNQRTIYVTPRENIQNFLQSIDFRL
ncbi:MAG: NFACT family protein [Selenomonadaceae bacterium]|nr:NFACT family protein [Selenomonadaceae bacterium]